MDILQLQKGIYTDMALRTIREYGDDVLAKECREVKEITPRVRELVEDMLDTMYDANGVGLAAPQVGKSIRLVVIDLDALSEDLPEYKDFHRVYINPHIIEADESDTDTSEEGCLSVPGIHEKVVRPKRIRVQWTDEQWQPHDEWVEGYLARVMHHEFDHLDAHLFIDRISPLRKQLIKNKLKAMKQGRYECDDRTKQ